LYQKHQRSQPVSVLGPATGKSTGISRTGIWEGW